MTSYFARATLALALVAMGAGGCALPGALLYKFVGPPAIPARYKVPQIPLLVLVENAHSGSIAIPETDALAQVICEDLRANKVAPLIDPDKIHDLRDRNPLAFGKMSIAEIGRQMGAQQVLYIHVHQLEIEAPQAGEVVRLKIGLNVKVVETATARAVWPDGGDTEPFNVETPWQRIEPGTSRSALNHQILRDSGTEIARWFYEYKPETMREENRERLR